MIPPEWQRLVQSGDVRLVDPPKPEPQDPYDTPEYQAFVESMQKHCHCRPDSARPCDGVLAGGLCDQMDWEDGRYGWDDEDD